MFEKIVLASLAFTLFAGCSPIPDNNQVDDTNSVGDTGVQNVMLTFVVNVPSAMELYEVPPPGKDLGNIYIDGHNVTEDIGVEYDGEIFTFDIEWPKNSQYDHEVELEGFGAICAPLTFDSNASENETIAVSWEADQCRFDTSDGNYTDGAGHSTVVEFDWDDLDGDEKDEAVILFMEDWAIVKWNLVPEVPWGGTIALENTLENMVWTGPTGTNYHLYLVGR